MFRFVKSYLKFLWKSKNEHGIHSPFVFDLVTKCFYDKTQYIEYQKIKNYRNELIANKNYINVTDFGAGSRVFKSNKRQICKIAKTAGISQKRAKLLCRIVKYFQPKNILEIGTSLGIATYSMTLAKENAKIISLEGCTETSKIAMEMFQVSSFKFQEIEIINTEFEKYLKTHNLQPTTYNLIYFDGNHSKSATLEYFNLLLPSISNDSVWIFDDIHWSQDMENAWEMIKNHPKVTVTIDTFHWGIVFFRTEQEKEHFTIRV